MFALPRSMRRALGIAAILSAMTLGACRVEPPAPRPAGGLGLRARLERTLTGHSETVMSVAFSPDARLLASGSVDRTVKLWRLSDGTVAQTLKHPEGITSLSFDPDGQRLATGSYDRAVRIWRLRDGAVEQTLAGHGGTVWSVAFSPDGQRLASSGEDKTVRLWRASDGAALRTIAGHALNVWSVSFSPDGRWLASGSFDKTVKVWDADTGALARTLTGHRQAVVSVAFAPRGGLLASGGDDSSIRLWRADGGDLVNTLTGGTNHVYAVAFSPDGEWLASAGREKGALGTLWKQIAGIRGRGRRGATVRLWRASDGALQQSLAEHLDDVRGLAVSPDGKWLASGSDDKTVKLWRLETISAGESSPTPIANRREFRQ